MVPQRTSMWAVPRTSSTFWVMSLSFCSAVLFEAVGKAELSSPRQRLGPDSNTINRHSRMHASALVYSQTAGVGHDCYGRETGNDLHKLSEPWGFVGQPDQDFAESIALGRRLGGPRGSPPLPPLLGALHSDF